MAVKVSHEGRTYNVGMRKTDPKQGKPCDAKGVDGKVCGKIKSPHFCVARLSVILAALALLKSYALGIGEGQTFKLLLWQLHRVVEPLFAIVIWNEQKQKWVRRYRKVWIVVGRQNGKTVLAAVLICILLRLCKPGTQMLLAAQNKEACRDLLGARVQEFLTASEMEEQPFLAEVKWSKSKQQFYFENERGKTFAKLVAVTDPNAVRGGKWEVIVFDEAAFYKDPAAVINIAETSWGAADEPIMLITTTLPGDVMSWGRQRNAEMEKVMLDPDLEPDALPVIYGLQEGDDYLSEEVWMKRCPALAEGVLDIDMFRDYATRSEVSLEARQYLIEELLNSPRIEDTAWLAMDAWDWQPWMDKTLNFDEIDWDGIFEKMKKLKGGIYAGADFSRVHDLTALALIANWGGRTYVWVMAWIPQKIRADLNRRTGGAVERWIKQGRLRVLPNVEEPAALVAEEMANILKQLPGLVRVGYDEHDAAEAVKVWKANGLDVKRVQQGSVLSPAIKDIEGAVQQGMIVHGACPVLRWSVGSAEVVASDKEKIRLKKPDRKTAAARIDPVVALCTARMVQKDDFEARNDLAWEEHVFEVGESYEDDMMDMENLDQHWRREVEEEDDDDEEEDEE